MPTQIQNRNKYLLTFGKPVMKILLKIYFFVFKATHSNSTKSIPASRFRNDKDFNVPLSSSHCYWNWIRNANNNCHIHPWLILDKHYTQLQNQTSVTIKVFNFRSSSCKYCNHLRLMILSQNMSSVGPLKSNNSLDINNNL